LKSNAHHIAIVGKEPLIDAESVAITERLVSLFVGEGKTVSLSTNGLGLHRLSDKCLADLEWIDVSLDGGPLTYSQYRRGNFDRVLNNVRESLSNGARSFNVLHTISSLNVGNLNDMMAVSGLSKWHNIIFSPYTQDQIQEKRTISSVPIDRFLKTFQECDNFLRNQSSYVLIGNHSFKDQGLNNDAVRCKIQEAQLSDKVIFIEQDPLLLGYVRVTYDGYLMTPYQSLYSSDFYAFRIPLEKHSSLNSAYQYLRAA
jgi:hypothetical protein